jgi:hypothetical protein
MIAGEEHAYFGVLSLLFELLNLAFELGHHILPLFRELRKRFQVFNISRQFGVQLNVMLEAAARLQDSLRLFLIVPEIRTGYFFFQLENLRAFSLRIKDTLESAVSFRRLRSLFHEVPRAFTSSSSQKRLGFHA